MILLWPVARKNSLKKRWLKKWCLIELNFLRCRILNDRIRVYNKFELLSKLNFNHSMNRKIIRLNFLTNEKKSRKNFLFRSMNQCFMLRLIKSKRLRKIGLVQFISRESKFAEAIGSNVEFRFLSLYSIWTEPEIDSEGINLYWGP